MEPAFSLSAASFLDLVSKLLDRLIQLATFRRELNRRVFESHVEPIFEGLRPIVDDYRQMFQQVDRLLTDPTVPLLAVVKEIHRIREKYRPARSEIYEYASALSEANLSDDVKRFAQVCIRLVLHQPTEGGPEDSVVIIGGGYKSLSGGLLADLGLAVSAHMNSDLFKVSDSELMKINFDALLCGVPREKYANLASRHLSRLEAKWSSAVKSYYELRTKSLR
jgi:hypothetical protein